MKKTTLRTLKLNKKTVTTLNNRNASQMNGGKYPTTVFNCTRNTCESYSCDYSCQYTCANSCLC